MKFTASLSSLLLLLPLLAQQVTATPLNFQSGVSTGKNAAPAKGAASSAKVVATKAASSSAAAPSASASSTSNNNSNNNNSSDAQSSLTLDPKVVATGFENNGQDVPTAGQVASLTSDNNFINFCLTVPNLPITNGQQVTTGSCNPAPMGVIAATTNMPSSKFQFPKNGDVVQSNTPFTVSMAISHLDTGFFVNANENYFSAPQFVNSAGDIQGHSHVVIELLSSVQQTSPTNPNFFAFFKGLNAPAQNGVLTVDVANGLPAGSYRMASINSAANHQPVLVAVAQHGSLDDMVYFTVSDNGQSSNSTSSSAAAATASASTGKGNGASASQAAASQAAASQAAASQVAVSQATSASAAKASATVGLKSGNTGKNGNQAGNTNTNTNQNQNTNKAPVASKGNNKNAFPFGNQKGGNNAAQFPGRNGFGGFKVKRNALNRADN